MDDLIDPQLMARIQAANRRRASRLGLLAILAGAVGTVAEFLNQCSLLSYPPGSAIRPMDMTFRTLFLAIATPLVALPLAGSAVMVGRRWLLGGLGLILGLSPMVVTVVVGRIIVAAQGLTLKP